MEGDTAGGSTTGVVMAGGGACEATVWESVEGEATGGAVEDSP